VSRTQSQKVFGTIRRPRSVRTICVIFVHSQAKTGRPSDVAGAVLAMRARRVKLPTTPLAVRAFVTTSSIPDGPVDASAVTDRKAMQRAGARTAATNFVRAGRENSGQGTIFSVPQWVQCYAHGAEALFTTVCAPRLRNSTADGFSPQIGAIPEYNLQLIYWKFCLRKNADQKFLFR